MTRPDDEDEHHRTGRTDGGPEVADRPAAFLVLVIAASRKMFIMDMARKSERAVQHGRIDRTTRRTVTEMIDYCARTAWPSSTRRRSPCFSRRAGLEHVADSRRRHPVHRSDLQPWVTARTSKARPGMLAYIGGEVDPMPRLP